MYYQLALILLLLNFYCNALPLPSIDSNEQTTTTTTTESVVGPVHDQWMSLQTLHEYEFLRMLCELYGRCSSDEEIDNEESMFDYHQTKFKRFSPRLFYGIPKFG